jgi:hypothetical protein
MKLCEKQNKKGWENVAQNFNYLNKRNLQNTFHFQHLQGQVYFSHKIITKNKLM